MRGFIERYGKLVTGVLSGLDRVLFRGTQRIISNARGMMNYLWHKKILLKQFGDYAMELSEQVREASESSMKAMGCEYRYLNNPGIDKEDLARQLAQERGIRHGAVCLLGAVEPCMSYRVGKHRNGDLVLVPAWRKCLHLYHYYLDERWGLMHVRLQTWFPMGVRVCMNGREWLMRSLDSSGIAYQQADNALRWVEDFGKAQQLLAEQFKENWAETLGEHLRRSNPGLSQLLTLDGNPLEYYWSAEEREYATDVVFKDARSLGSIYGQLVQASMLSMGCQQVLRYLGKRKHYQGELKSHLRGGDEGVRVKHWAGRNSIKMYDKHGQVLRVETTINDTSDFRVYRGTEREPEAKEYRRMRKGVADLQRSGEICERANGRYLEHLSTIQTDQTLGELLVPLAKAVTRKGKRHRGLRVLSMEDGALLSAVARGDHAINGFRNADIRVALLGPDPEDAKELRRRSGQITRRLGLLRAHGLIGKVSGTRRWILTAKGRRTTMLLGAANHAKTSDLLRAA